MLEICQAEFHSKSIYRIPIAFLSALGVFYILAIIITIISFKNQQNNEIRTKYIKQHRVILFVLVFAWFFPMVTNVLIIIGD